MPAKIKHNLNSLKSFNLHKTETEKPKYNILFFNEKKDSMSKNLLKIKIRVKSS